jgi:hypothetical protein
MYKPSTFFWRITTSSGSSEGFIYTAIPIEKQINGYFEVLLQTLSFSLIVFDRCWHPCKLCNKQSAVLLAVIITTSILEMTISVQ